MLIVYIFVGDYNFQRLFICPYESRMSFQHMRKWIAVDGTFMKTRFIQTLLFAAGIDGNGQTVILAWGIVESENSSSWRWFLEHLQRALPQLGQESFTLISDRDKGLMSADQTVFGNRIHRMICCYHLKRKCDSTFLYSIYRLACASLTKPINHMVMNTITNMVYCPNRQSSNSILQHFINTFPQRI